MAIVKLYNKTFQVKVKGPDGRWITRVFPTRNEAEVYETNLKRQKHSGNLASNSSRQVTLNDFYVTWFETIQHQASPGWRAVQNQLYREYISETLGHCKLHNVSPALISSVLNDMKRKGKSEQTRLHAFNLLRKMFSDAMELFQLTTFNPAIRKLKPKVPIKDPRHLNVAQVSALLEFVKDQPYGTAIWLQLFLGLRVGEVQALQWSDVDLETSQVHIRQAFSRKDTWATKRRVIKEFPKGKKHHSVSIPPELLEHLKEKKREACSLYAASSPRGLMVEYERYLRKLKFYCKELGFPPIGTHGLRHSTSAVYLKHGANKDDLRKLFAHSCPSLTERYTHGEGDHLREVSNVIRLLPQKVSKKVSNDQNF